MNILNKYCPRSGKPIQKDSLTEYRGHTVGFCNQSCRDDFESNVKDRPEDRHYFDTLIQEYDLDKEPERAQPGDKSAIKQFLDHANCHEDLTKDHLEHFFVIKREEDLSGVIGLEIFEENGLLRSLAVKEESWKWIWGNSRQPP